MKEVSRCEPEETCPDLWYLSAVNPSFNTRTNNGLEWIILHQAGEVTKESVNNCYEGNTNDSGNFWAIKWRVNDDSTMKPVKMKDESLYLKNEECLACFEFAPKEMIISAFPVHIYIIRKW